MTQHTPGPWLLTHNKQLDIYFIKSQDGESICDLYVRNEEQVHRFQNAQANAHLITNVTDLLDALERIERIEDDYSDRGHGSAKEKMREVARAAIAKAVQS